MANAHYSINKSTTLLGVWLSRGLTTLPTNETILVLFSLITNANGWSATNSKSLASLKQESKARSSFTSMKELWWMPLTNNSTIHRVCHHLHTLSKRQLKTHVLQIFRKLELIANLELRNLEFPKGDIFRRNIFIQEAMFRTHPLY